MKKHFTLLICLILAVTTTMSAQIGNNNRLVFVANLTSSQEVPPTSSDARGVASFVISEDRKTMTVHGVFSQLSGPITGCHIHTGLAGTSGGVYINFANDIDGNELRASVTLPPDFMQQALGKALYLNVHTSANPGGEIRGQLELQSDVFYSIALNGFQEVPSVTTDSYGAGYLTYSPGSTTARYRIVLNGLGGTPTASHIHVGTATNNGAVVVPLTIVSNTLIQGEIDLTTVPSDFFQNLEAEGLYANVHTAAHPGGEIRGQLLAKGPIFLEGFLNGDQEVPPVTTAAQGLSVAWLSTDLSAMVYLAVANGFTPSTGHFHFGAAGTNGPVLTPLSIGLPNFYQNLVSLSPDTVTMLLNSEIYINMHSNVNPNGEIRAQMIPNLRQVYAFDICDVQEVPSTGTGGIGTAVVTHDWLNTHLNYLYIVDGLTGPPTAAHVHSGEIGANGGVLLPINVPNPVGSGQFPIDGDVVSALLSGDTYLNVHTAANPGGEVRGQVRLGSLCNVSATEFVSYVTGLTVFPNPASEAATVRFESELAFEGYLTLTNLTGQQVLIQKIKVEIGETAIPINLKDQPIGLYFGQIKSTDGNTIAFKLVKE